MYDVLVKNGRVVMPEVGVMDIDLAITDGKVAGLIERDQLVDAKQVIDAEGNFILPGLIDPHVHWGLFGATLEEQTETESRSAAIGGYTTVLQYRRSPYFDKKSFDEIVDAMKKTSHIDFSLQPFITMNRHINGIQYAAEDYGISSFKIFTTEREELSNSNICGLSNSNIPEPYTDGFCLDAMKEMAKFEKVVANLHAENIEIVEKVAPKVRDEGKQGLPAWNEARPTYAEAETANRLNYFSELTDCPLYIVHLSCKEVVDVIRTAKKSNSKIYSETCPHYLILDDQSEIDLLGKVNPPLRSKSDQDALWEGLRDGTIDAIGSDNCAARKVDKQGDIWTAEPGFAGTGTILPALLSEGYNKDRLSILDIAKVTSWNAAKIFNMYPKKGTLLPGSDADLVILDTEKTKRVTAEDVQSWSDFTVFEGREFKGWPKLTMLRGKVIAKDGELVEENYPGMFIQRKCIAK